METKNIKSKMITPLSEGNQRSAYSSTFNKDNEEKTMCACCMCDPNSDAKAAGDVTARISGSTMNSKMIEAGSVAIKDILQP